MSWPWLKTWRIKILKVSTVSECCRGQYEQIVKRSGNCWKGWISWQALKMVLCSPAFKVNNRPLCSWEPCNTHCESHKLKHTFIPSLFLHESWFSAIKKSYRKYNEKAYYCKEKWELRLYRETQSSRFTLMWLFLNPCVFSYRGPDNTVCFNDIPR